MRAAWITFGALCVSGGLAIMAFDNQFLVGGAISFVGFLRLMTAFSMDSRRVRAHPADPDDPRWLPDRTKRPQVAGKQCTECGRKITVASEGVACDVCDDATHVACSDLHRAHVHRPEGVGPFR